MPPGYCPVPTTGPVLHPEANRHKNNAEHSLSCQRYPLGSLGPNFWVPNSRIQLFAWRTTTGKNSDPMAGPRPAPGKHEHQHHSQHLEQPGNLHHVFANYSFCYCLWFHAIFGKKFIRQIKLWEWHFKSSTFDVVQDAVQLSVTGIKLGQVGLGGDQHCWKGSENLLGRDLQQSMLLKQPKSMCSFWTKIHSFFVEIAPVSASVIFELCNFSSSNFLLERFLRFPKGFSWILQF